jgi:hypothetical protein
MNELKSPMSLAYKAVFAFVIFMIFASLLGGSKSGIGILLWGYTTWLMYKRNNAMLVTLFSGLLWFEVIAGGIGFIVIALNVDDISVLWVYGVFILVAIIVAYGLKSFFLNQAKGVDVKTPAKAYSHTTLNDNKNASMDIDELWANASKEFNSESRNEGLWAKSFAEANGNADIAKALYLKEVVSRLSVVGKSVVMDESSAILLGEEASHISISKVDKSDDGTARYFIGMTVAIIGGVILLIFLMAVFLIK